ncbi:MAG TPA: diphosphate--fructose-6-phosphate 1-phosphotransferase [Nitrospiraceae bacterium]|nr:diphosphate--fructose-6-phosphate 1-phosphotransferase [Nitrospiraceae bacterium]
MNDTVAILVGGGPAPGINGVIGAATIRCLAEGKKVLGIEQGFKWIMQGDVSKIMPLTLEQVSRIHVRGGSLLKTARANPTKNSTHLAQALKSLVQLGVTGLITIGGDDTCFSALTLERSAQGRLRVVHVPKTIDNDLDLPQGVPTFGFQTARHVGTYAVNSILEDARTTSHWFFVVAMGRKAGHLALGIGKAAGATLTLIPEEFRERPVRLASVADILVGAIIKRLSEGREDGVAVIAEGLAEVMPPGDFAALASVSRDEHGHVELADLDLGRALKEEVLKRLTPYGIAPTIRLKDLGFELRCADPIPFDMEYCRDLGCCAADFLIAGGTGAMVSVVNGIFAPIPFDTILDPATQRTRVRMVDIAGESYRIARRYMIRLDGNDFEERERLARCAAVVGLTTDSFRERFASVAAHERGT